MNKEILEFIEKYENNTKYLVLEDGFVQFEFSIENEQIGIKLENPFEEIELEGKIIYFKEYDPTKLTMAGNMKIMENYLMYTKYNDIMIFVLV